MFNILRRLASLYVVRQAGTDGVDGVVIDGQIALVSFKGGWGIPGMDSLVGQGDHFLGAGIPGSGADGVLQQQLQQLGHGRLRRDCNLAGPVRECQKRDAAQCQIEGFQQQRAIRPRSRQNDGDVLDVAAHEHVELQNVGLQRDATEPLQNARVQFGQVPGRVTQHQPPSQGHPEAVWVHGIVHELVRVVPK